MSKLESVRETRFVNKVEGAGGWPLKMYPFSLVGIPDRMVIFPGGVVGFAELKRDKKGPSPIQKSVHRKFLRFGLKVWVIDTDSLVDEFVEWCKKRSEIIVQLEKDISTWE